MSGNLFLQTRAFLDTIRYEETEKMHHKINQHYSDLRKDQAEDPDRVWWASHEDRVLTPWEVYLEAVADVMLIIDERLGELHHRNER